MASFPGLLEIALGADRSAPAVSWTWTDITQYARTPEIEIRTGLADRGSDPQPASLEADLTNDDGRFTPRNPVGAYYPNWGRGTPMRHSVQAGGTYLLTTGNAGARASTTDKATLDITGDTFAIAELWAPIAKPVPGALPYELAAKFNVVGNQRSWLWYLQSDGKIGLRWSTNGTNEFDAVSGAALPRPVAGLYSIAFYFDVDVGALFHRVHFWGMRGTKADLIAAIAAGDLQARVGDPFTGGGATSVFSSTAPLELGDVAGSGFVPYPGQTRKFELRSGDHTGTVAANPDFTAQSAGTTSFSDTAPTTNTWSVNAPAAITDRQVRFLGEVTSIKPTWPESNSDGSAQVTVEAAGILRRLRQGEEPLRSTLWRAVMSPLVASDIIGYWPMEDESGATQFSSPIPGVLPMTHKALASVVSMQLASDSALAASEPLPTIQGGQFAAFNAPVPNRNVVSGQWAIEFFCRMPTVPSATFVRLLGWFTFGTVWDWRLHVNNANVLLEGRNQDGSLLINQTSSVDASFFGASFVLVRIDAVQNGGNIDWDVTYIPLNRNGVGFGFSNSVAGTLGRVARIGDYVTAQGDGYSLGHVIVQTGNQLLGWLGGSDQAFQGERAGVRMGRLCGEEAIPLLIHGDPTDTEPMGPQRPAPLTELLTECSAADRGIISELPTYLGLHYRTGGSLHGQASRLDADTGLINPFEPTDDDATLVNVQTVQRANGSSSVQQDATSIAAVGRYKDSITLNLAEDTQVDNQAYWRLALGTWPELRLPAMALELAKDPDLVTAWLGCALGDLVTAQVAVDEYPPDDLDQLFVGYRETIGAQRWAVELNTAPAGPWQAGKRDDGTTARRDTAGSELASGIDDDDTSLSVATTLGPVWTAVDADDGFDINIGGERMTVTDISGTTSPQTFTVTRSVNGVVKSHSAGAAVRLWRPLIRPFSRKVA